MNMCLGIPGKVITIEGDDPIYRMGKVEFGKIAKKVSLAFVPDVQVGGYVIVHAGFAISELDEEEAQTVFRTIEELDQAALKEELIQ
jgi:hydrogenase expression/formation protein HypC